MSNIFISGLAQGLELYCFITAIFQCIVKNRFSNLYFKTEYTFSIYQYKRLEKI